MENIKKVIGKRINSLLCERNMKQKEFAKCLGVTDNTVSYFVNGSRMPNMEQLVKIADFFNVSVDYILGRTEIANTNTELRSVCEFTGLKQSTVECISMCSKKPFLKLFLEYFIEEKELRTLLVQYFVSTSVQNAIKDSQFKLIPRKKDKEIRIIFADIIEQLPILRKDFENELKKDDKLFEELCFEYLSWLMDDEACESYIKEFYYEDDLDMAYDIDERDEEFDIDTFYEEIDVCDEKIIQEYEEKQREDFEKLAMRVNLIEKVFKYRKNKEGVTNGNNTQKG